MSDPSKGASFVKGGFGCLLAIVALGLIALMVGGTVSLDAGGAVFLFILGGIAGLIWRSIYQRGVRAGRQASDDQGPHE